MTPEREKQIRDAFGGQIPVDFHTKELLAELDRVRADLVIAKDEKWRAEEAGWQQRKDKDDFQLRYKIIEKERDQLRADNILLTLGNDEIGYAQEARVYKKECEQLREKLAFTVPLLEERYLLLKFIESRGLLFEALEGVEKIRGDK